MFEYDVVVAGGLGHVGLPLAITFANTGLKVSAYDINKETAEKVRNGEMPFIEYGSEEILKKVLKDQKLTISTDISDLGKGRFLIIALGTPVDEYLNPKTRQFLEFFEKARMHLSPQSIIIMRSTVYPNTCKQVLAKLKEDGQDWHLSYCPERIIQGHAMKELHELPQLVSGFSERAIEESSKLFGQIASRIVRVDVGEAELAKLFSNAWRYIQFATTNQFYMIAEDFGVDYNKVRQAIRDGYKRGETLPKAGFAAGPCLLKDTMQLAAYSGNNFMLGHAAMLINEGLPNFIVEQLKRKYEITTAKIGILGMAFKADIDDVRDSLSFKLGKILRFNGVKVYYSDEFAKNPDFVSKEELVKNSDIIIVAVPHSAYKSLEVPKNKIVVDLWEVIPKQIF